MLAAPDGCQRIGLVGPIGVLQDIVHHAAELLPGGTAGRGRQGDGLDRDLLRFHGASESLGGGDPKGGHAGFFDAGGPPLLPLLVAAQAFGRLLGSAVQHLLVLYAGGAGDAEVEHRGIKPDHLVTAGFGVVQTRLHRHFLRLVGRAVENGRAAEPGTPGRRARDAPAVFRRIERIMQGTEPAALAIFFPDGGDHEEIARAGCRDVGHAGGLFLVGLLLGRRGVQQFPRRAPEQTLRAQAAIGIREAVSALRPGQLRGEIGQDDDRKLQPLGLVDGHQFDAAAFLLDHRRFAGVAGFVLALEVIDEGAEGGGRAAQLRSCGRDR